MQLSRREFGRGVLGVAAGLLAAPVSPRALLAAERDASELDFASAMAVARAIANKEYSCREVMEHVLARIERYNGPLNAIVQLRAEQALAEADARDAALARGESLGPFHGVPITLKESIALAGTRTSAGVFADHVPERDAVAAARMKAAGAVIVGKTNVPAMLADWQSYNEIYGTTNNPWDVARSPGGSTGGGAAAVAAGLSYLSVGSDIGGSIRVPASFCGVFGHKPTFDVVPLTGHVPPPPNAPPSLPPNLPVIGPLARSAADLAAALAVLGGPEEVERVAYRWELPPPRKRSLAEFRVGFVLSDTRCPVTTEVGDVLAAALRGLREAGAKLREGWPGGVDPAAQYGTYRALLATVQRRPEAPQSTGDYLAAEGQRLVARGIWSRFFAEHDVFLMPTSFVPAFPHDHSQPLEQRKLATAEGERDYIDLLFWISFATLTGLPATSVPVGLTRSGLPVGLQVLGPYLEDATPIEFAGLLTERLGGVPHPPLERLGVAARSRPLPQREA